MKLTKAISLPSVIFLGMFLVGCTTPTAPQQADQQQVTSRTSTVSVARSAYDFEDADIRIPAFFDTQGLAYCNFSIDNENESCPLRKKVINIYFNENDVDGDGVGMPALQQFDASGLVTVLEAQFAGVNRYRIATRDDAVTSAARQRVLEQQGAARVAERAAENSVLEADLVIAVDTLRTARTDSAIRSWIEYNLLVTARIIDPFTGEVMSHPNIGTITVGSADVVDRDSLSFIRANNQYMSGFEYHKSGPVSRVLNDMAARAFTIMLTRLLSEMPSTAQVVGIRDNQISLDRGQNAGVLPNETMIIFETEGGFATPIGVANVNPSMNSAQGEIVRWKKNSQADRIRAASKNTIYQPDGNSRVFGVSVGTPPTYLRDRT